MNPKHLFVLICLFASAMLRVSIAQASFRPDSDTLKRSFESTLAREAVILLQLIDDRPEVRQEALSRMQSSAYQEHLRNYLSYYQSLPQGDLFSGIIERDEIVEIERRTRNEYFSLLAELFGLSSIQGDSFFRIFMSPDHSFTSSVKEEIVISADLDWNLLFSEMRKSLPFGHAYKTRLRIDPKRVGGYYDEVSDEIVIGSHAPNIATVLGFVHEFGHSVFLIAGEEADSLRILATNESYAEIWAAETLKFSFADKIFASSRKLSTIQKYLRFRDLLSLRFHLFVLDLDRRVRNSSHLNERTYSELVEQHGRVYLGAENFPPVVPVMPQMRIPGYLQSYLAIPFLKAQSLPRVREDALIQSLIDLGPLMLREASVDQFPTTLRNAVQACLKGRLGNCLDESAETL